MTMSLVYQILGHKLKVWTKYYFLSQGITKIIKIRPAGNKFQISWQSIQLHGHFTKSLMVRQRRNWDHQSHWESSPGKHEFLLKKFMVIHPIIVISVWTKMVDQPQSCHCGSQWYKIHGQNSVRTQNVFRFNTQFNL